MTELEREAEEYANTVYTHSKVAVKEAYIAGAYGDSYGEKFRQYEDRITELEKEAEEWLDAKYLSDMGVRRPCKVAYLAGAEPREKRIAELEETCNKWFEHLKSREEELLNELNNQNLKYNKRIEELEKENEELKKEVEKHKWNNILLEDCAEYDKKIAEEYTTLQERIAELEKENAELKARINAINLLTPELEKRSKLKTQQLIKAKELLKQWLQANICDSVVLFSDTEQFLKGSEVEK